MLYADVHIHSLATVEKWSASLRHEKCLFNWQLAAVMRPFRICHAGTRVIFHPRGALERKRLNGGQLKRLDKVHSPLIPGTRVSHIFPPFGHAKKGEKGRKGPRRSGRWAFFIL